MIKNILIAMVIILTCGFLFLSELSAKAQTPNFFNNFSVMIANLQSLVAKIQSAIPVSKMKAQLAPTDGLVGHWKFDETSGTAVADSSGNSNNGTLTNGPVWSTGKISNALFFDGADDYVNVTSDSSLNVYPLTVSAWIKTSANNSNQRGVISKYLSASLNGYQIFLRGGDIYAWYFKDENNSVYGSGDGLAGGAVSDNEWHHIIFTVDATGGKLYVDNIQKDSKAWVGTPGSTTSSQDLRIGSYPPDATNYFPGSIDDVRVYSRVLSVSEIQELRKLGEITYDPVNGVCGAAMNQCVQGTLLDTNDGGNNYLWQCVGSNSGTTSNCSLAINLTAYNLAVSKAGIGSGTVSGGSISCGSACSQSNIAAGTQITLTAAIFD
jgi:hypothetical protein